MRGELSLDSGHFTCSGSLTLLDAVLSDPIKLVLEATDALTIRRSNVSAPIIELIAPQIVVSDLPGSDSENIPTPIPIGTPGALSSRLLEGEWVPNLNVETIIGAGFPLNGGRISLHSQGGVLQVDGGKLTLTGGSGTSVRLIVGEVPEPSTALLLVAGLGALALRRRMHTDRQ